MMLKDIFELKCWIPWTTSPDGRKVPSLDGSLGLKWGDTSIRLTHTEAAECIARYPSLKGNGFEVPDHVFVADIDDLETAESIATGMKIVRKFGSYSEYSPSHKGFHVIMAAANLSDRYPAKILEIEGMDVEVKSPGNHYVTFTGEPLPGFDNPELADWSAAIDAMYRESGWQPNGLIYQPPFGYMERPEGGAGFCKCPGDCAYGITSLDRECQKVQTARKGSRHPTLMHSAFKVGRLIAGGHLDEDAAVRALVRAGQSTHPPVLDMDKVSVDVADGVRDGKKRPVLGVNCMSKKGIRLIL